MQWSDYPNASHYWNWTQHYFERKGLDLTQVESLFRIVALDTIEGQPILVRYYLSTGKVYTLRQREVHDGSHDQGVWLHKEIYEKLWPGRSYFVLDPPFIKVFPLSNYNPQVENPIDNRTPVITSSDYAKIQNPVCPRCGFSNRGGFRPSLQGLLVHDPAPRGATHSRLLRLSNPVKVSSSIFLPCCGYTKEGQLYP